MNSACTAVLLSWFSAACPFQQAGQEPGPPPEAAVELEYEYFPYDLIPTMPYFEYEKGAQADAYPISKERRSLHEWPAGEVEVFPFPIFVSRVEDSCNQACIIRKHTAHEDCDSACDNHVGSVHPATIELKEEHVDAIVELTESKWKHSHVFKKNGSLSAGISGGGGKLSAGGGVSTEEATEIEGSVSEEVRRTVSSMVGASLSIDACDSHAPACHKKEVPLGIRFDFTVTVTPVWRQRVIYYYGYKGKPAWYRYLEPYKVNKIGVGVIAVPSVGDPKFTFACICEQGAYPVLEGKRINTHETTTPAVEPVTEPVYGAIEKLGRDYFGADDIDIPVNEGEPVIIEFAGADDSFDWSHGVTFVEEDSMDGVASKAPADETQPSTIEIDPKHTDKLTVTSSPELGRIFNLTFDTATKALSRLRLRHPADAS